MLKYGLKATWGLEKYAQSQTKDLSKNIAKNPRPTQKKLFALLLEEVFKKGAQNYCLGFGSVWARSLG